MTDEEYQAKVSHYNMLVEEYNQLVYANAELEQELDLGIQNCYVVADNITSVAGPVSNDVHILSDNLDTVTEVVEDLYRCLVDVTEKYFLFKNLSTASKNLTQFNDLYYTRFHFYNELRRITLGYVIGIDAHIVRSESLRKKVEKAYLANTDYWLAYAISAVMLWASDEREAAYRALNKSLVMDVCKSSIFFMLVNLRFKRMNTARNWFVTMLDKTDVNHLPEEWQHILHIYLTGAFKADQALQKLADSYFDKMLEQTCATNAYYMRRVSDYAYGFAKTYLHTTDIEYADLSRYCPEYADIKHLLSQAEKVIKLREYYDKVHDLKDDAADSMDEHIENVLYDLINAYDAEEFKIVKEIRFNEAILAAKGDVTAAREYFERTFGSMSQTAAFGDLMLYWAFSDDTKAVDVTVRKFSISRLKASITQGITRYLTECRDAAKERYPIEVAVSPGMTPLTIECNESEADSCTEKIKKHFEKGRLAYTLADKYMKIFIGMCVGALLLLAIAALLVGHSWFSVFLVLGIALGAIGGFLVWKRWVDVGNILRERCRMATARFLSCLKEMESWRTRLAEHYAHLDEIGKSIDSF